MTLLTNLHGIRSYMLFRQDGGTTPSGLAGLALTAAYGTPLVFKDDVAIAATPSVTYPTTGGFTSQGLQYINDQATGGAAIFISLDGLNDHFELKAQENIVFDFIKTQQIWLRGTAGGESYRLLVW